MRIEKRKAVFPILMLTMTQRGETCATLSSKMNLTPQALSSRLRGLAQFKQNEIDYLLDYFSLPYEKLFKHEDIDTLSS